MKRFNATQLKYVLAALMVLDHLPHVPGLVPSPWEGIFHALTRCVGVGFAFFAVEGFCHSRHLRGYLTRLWGAALLMQVGNLVINALTVNPAVQVHNNIFLTLAVGVTGLALAFPRQALTPSQQRWGWLIAAVLFLAGLVLTEGGTVILPFMLITYLTQSKPVLRYGLYSVLALGLFAMAYTDYGSWQVTLEMLLYNSDFLFITVIPLLALYNGQRGPKTAFSQWLFYAFYPAHLWLLAAIAALVS